MQGDFYTNTYEYLELKLWKCIDPANATVKKCADQATIDSFFDQSTFSMAFINNYFDLTEIDQSKIIKPFIDDSLFFELESQRIKMSNFYIQY